VHHDVPHFFGWVIGASHPPRDGRRPWSSNRHHPGRPAQYRAFDQIEAIVPEVRAREIAVRFTDWESYFVSEASVYRLLKAHDLITSPAFIVVKVADEFHTKTTAPNQGAVATPRKLGACTRNSPTFRSFP
jgi:hypothetical protein